MIGLTTRQRDTLEAIDAGLRAGRCPSIAELARATGARKNLAHRRVEALEAKGYIVREYGRARSIAIIRHY